jgi:DNA-binding transcriptional ArsR family regulator
MVKKYLMFDMNDPKSEKVAEILGNNTCKKILSLLAEREGELSVGDISKELNLAINTIDYNVKKLVDAGLIDKSSSFFWSVKGKKIPTYKIAHKQIIISTKTSFRGVLGSALIGGLLLGGIKTYMNYNVQNSVNSAPLSDMAYTAAPALMAKAAEATNLVQTPSLFSNVLIFVIVGLVIGALGFLLYLKMKGGKN